MGISPGSSALSDRLELAIIGEDNHRHVTADPIEREQVADTLYP